MAPAAIPPGPSEPEGIGSLQPDRLAELHTPREPVASPELSQARLNGLDPRQARRAVALLARASADYPDAEELLRQTLPAVAVVVAGTQAPGNAHGYRQRRPVPDRHPCPGCRHPMPRIIDLLPVDIVFLPRFWLNNLGVRFSELRRPADALPVTEEAVTIRRELAAAKPDRYRPDLASSLTNLGIRFSELGRPADALPVTEEAVTICRELAAAKPDRYRPDLATSLTNLGIRLSELGRPADALPVTEEAVTITGSWPPPARPLPPRPRRSLTNLGVTLSELGRPADALPVTEEAVVTYRELAAASPTATAPTSPAP